MVNLRRTMAQLLASKWGPWLAYSVGLLVSLPALGVGLLNDDLLHRMLLEGQVPGLEATPFGLYDFTGRDPAQLGQMVSHGYLPWWSADALSIRFFRPLSSFTLYLDHLAFSRAPFPAHLHSLAWFALMSAAVIRLLQRLLPPRTATVAALVYVLAGAHVMATAWLAARHSLIGGAFGALCLLGHVGWRQTGARWRQAGGLLALLFGLLASETALGAAVFVFLYAFLEEPQRPTRERCLAAAPAFVLACAHLTFYAVSGYGAHESGSYIAPFASPGAYVQAIFERLPVLLGELYGAAPALLWGVSEPARPALAAYGLFTSGLTVGLLLFAQKQLADKERRRLGWLGVFSVVCLVPMVGGVPGGRVLFFALIGSSALVATVLTSAWDGASDGGVVSGGLVRLGVVGLSLLHLAVGPLVRATVPGQLDATAQQHARIAEQTALDACADGSPVYLLSGSDPAIGMYSGAALGFYRPAVTERLDSYRTLSMVGQPHSLTTVDEHSFELSVDRSARRANVFERVMRQAPFRPGDVVGAEPLRVEVLEVSREGHWTRARFAPSVPVSEACFLRWDGARLRMERAPPVGETLHIDWHPGPMGL